MGRFSLILWFLGGRIQVISPSSGTARGWACPGLQLCGTSGAASPLHSPNHLGFGFVRVCFFSPREGAARPLNPPLPREPALQLSPLKPVYTPGRGSLLGPPAPGLCLVRAALSPSLWEGVERVNPPLLSPFPPPG